MEIKEITRSGTLEILLGCNGCSELCHAKTGPEIHRSDSELYHGITIICIIRRLLCFIGMGAEQNFMRVYTRKKWS